MIESNYKHVREIALSQAEMETAVPSLCDSTPYLFERVKDYLMHDAYEFEHDTDSYRLSWDNVRVNGKSLFEDLSEADNAKLALIRRYFYVHAAYKLIPSLDLVATPTGFGVVSNANVVPASAARVAALADALKREACELLESVFAQLGYTDKDGFFPFVVGFIPTPSAARRHGLQAPNGGRIDVEEFAAMRHGLTVAYLEVMKLVGQLPFILPATGTFDPSFDFSFLPANFPTRLHTLFSNLQAAYFTGIEVRKSEDLLLDTLDIMAENYPLIFTDYMQSSRYKSRHCKRYENTQDDPTFFFA